MTTCHDVFVSDSAASATDQEHEQRIVVGVDGSASSASALRWAARQARVSGARVEAVFVYEPAPSLSFSVGGYPAVNPVDPERARRTACASLEEAVQQALGRHATEIRLVPVADNSPAATLTRMSEGATMLVVGAHKHNVLGLLLGSTSAACVRHAVAPVVVVPTVA